MTKPTLGIDTAVPGDDKTVIVVKGVQTGYVVLPEIPADMDEAAVTELGQRLAAQMAQHQDNLVAQLWSGGGETHTATPNTEDNELTLDKLAAVMEKFRPREPFPKAIWFVDRPGLYYDFLQMVQPAASSPIESGRYYAPPGLPICDWRSAFATEEEWARVPAFCKRPGVYLEMSDGNHKEIVFGRPVHTSPFSKATNHTTNRPWPADCYLQCGDSGVVLSREGGYQTAFFEAFPLEPRCFIRGEGETIEAAEQAAWQQWEKIAKCPAHDFEARGRTDGYGYCRHCGMGAADVLPITNHCVVCGVAAAFSQQPDGWYCRACWWQIPSERWDVIRRTYEEMGICNEEDYQRYLAGIGKGGE